MRPAALRSLAPAFAALLAACSSSGGGNGNCPPTEMFSPGGPCDSPQPNLAWIQAHVFTPNCALPSCHATDGVRTKHLVLDNAADSYAHLVGVTALESTKKLVVPGDPAQSFLADKMACVNLTASSGVPMPYNSDLLCPGKITAVEQWIQSGAVPAPEPEAGPPDAATPDTGPTDAGTMDGRGPG